MNCYDQQYSGVKEKEPLSSRSVRSQIGNSSARDWRNANVMPVRDSVSGQEYQNQKETVVERQALYGQYGEWGWSCPNPGCSPSWQNPAADPGQTAAPGRQTAAEPGPGPNYPVGMAYVPMQRWGKTYDLDAGFSRGTIFPDLDLPFLAGRCI